MFPFFAMRSTIFECLLVMHLLPFIACRVRPSQGHGPLKNVATGSCLVPSGYTSQSIPKLGGAFGFSWSLSGATLNYSGTDLHLTTEGFLCRSNETTDPICKHPRLFLGKDEDFAYRYFQLIVTRRARVTNLKGLFCFGATGSEGAVGLIECTIDVRSSLMKGQFPPDLWRQATSRLDCDQRTFDVSLDENSGSLFSFSRGILRNDESLLVMKGKKTFLKKKVDEGFNKFWFIQTIERKGEKSVCMIVSELHRHLCLMPRFHGGVGVSYCRRARKWTLSPKDTPSPGESREIIKALKPSVKSKQYDNYTDAWELLETKDADFADTPDYEHLLYYSLATTVSQYLMARIIELGSVARPRPLRIDRYLYKYPKMGYQKYNFDHLEKMIRVKQEAKEVKIFDVNIEVPMEPGRDPDENIPEIEMPPLFSAISKPPKEARLSLIKAVLRHGVDVNSTWELNKTEKLGGRMTTYTIRKPSLHVAIDSKSVEAVQLLLENGADIEATDTDQRTPLIHAAINGTLEIVEKLLDHKANVRAQDDRDFTPLLRAVQKGEVEMARVLLEACSDSRIKARTRGTALIFATGLKENDAIALAMVETLLKFPPFPDLNAYGKCPKSHENCQALHIAVEMERPQIVKRLLSAGANKDAWNGKKNTSLEMAREQKKNLTAINKNTYDLDEIINVLTNRTKIETDPIQPDPRIKCDNFQF